jgi:uncharacterized protein YjbI with pentapeptide repeats
MTDKQNDASNLLDISAYVVPGPTADIRQVKIRETFRAGRFVPPHGHIVDFERAHVVGVDFSGGTFYAMRAVGSLFEECDFRRCRFETGHFYGRQTVFRRCDFGRADLRRLRPGTARFEECTFDHAKLDGWIARMSEFVECHFAGKIRGVNFSASLNEDDLRDLDPPRTANEFRGNDFRQAQLMGVDFKSGIDLDQQCLPGGPDQVRLDRIQERVARALALVSMWPQSKERDELRRGLEVQAMVYEDRDEAFVHRSDFKGRVGKRLLELLIEALPSDEQQQGRSL